jgi:hypothetical protein
MICVSRLPYGHVHSYSSVRVGGLAQHIAHHGRRYWAGRHRASAPREGRPPIKPTLNIDALAWKGMGFTDAQSLPNANPVLWAHDWHTGGGAPWKQDMVANGRGDNGLHAVEFAHRGHPHVCFVC